MTNKRSGQTQRASDHPASEAARDIARRQFLQAVNAALRTHTHGNLRLSLREGRVGIYRRTKRLDIHPDETSSDSQRSQADKRSRLERIEG